MSSLDEISIAEILDCIEDAKAGQLSPYWQGYAAREFDSLRRADGTLPEPVESLFQQLQTLLRTIPQIPDAPE